MYKNIKCSICGNYSIEFIENEFRCSKCDFSKNNYSEEYILYEKSIIECRIAKEYYKNDIYEEAINHYTNAINFNGNNIFAYYDRAMIYIIKKEHELALADIMSITIIGTNENIMKSVLSHKNKLENILKEEKRQLIEKKIFEEKRQKGILEKKKFDEKRQKEILERKKRIENYHNKINKQKYSMRIWTIFIYILIGILTICFLIIYIKGFMNA